MNPPDLRRRAIEATVVPFPIPDITPPETKIYLVCTIYITKTKTPRQLGKNVLKLENMHRAILLLKKIPKGKVTTYKEMARVCGTSPRAIGRIMANNSDPIGFPCYKVVASNGELCGYSGHGGLTGKKKLLQKDGIKLINGKVDKKYFVRFK